MRGSLVPPNDEVLVGSHRRDARGPLLADAHVVVDAEVRRGAEAQRIQRGAVDVRVSTAAVLPDTEQRAGGTGGDVRQALNGWCRVVVDSAIHRGA